MKGRVKTVSSCCVIVVYPHQLQVATNGKEMRFHVRAKMTSQEGMLENPGMIRNGTGSTFPHGEDAIVWIWRRFVTRDSTKQRECLWDSWAGNCHLVHYYPRQCVDLFHESVAENVYLLAVVIDYIESLTPIASQELSVLLLNNQTHIFCFPYQH